MVNKKNLAKSTEKSKKSVKALVPFLLIGLAAAVLIPLLFYFPDSDIIVIIDPNPFKWRDIRS